MTLIQRSYKTELDPNNKQRAVLMQHAGMARFVYNWGLARRINEYKSTGKASSFYAQCRQLNALKAEFYPWMYESSKFVAEESLRDLDNAFKNFFRTANKAGRKVGFPKFKSRKRGIGGFRLRGSVSVEDGRIRLPKIGWMRLKEAGYLPSDCKINSVTVRERAGRWFVSIQVEAEIVVPENQGDAIGLDLGLSALVVGSDGVSIPPPRTLARSLDKLRKLSRSMSHKQSGSANWVKAKRKLARLHYKIECQRTDYLHKVSSRLTHDHSVLVVENLNIQGMLRNHKLARSISDAGWGQLLSQLSYKAKWYGAQVVEAGRFYPSTKTCSACGRVKDSMSLSDRVYRCAFCGAEIDRDINAAKNLEKLGTAGLAGSYACGDRSLERSLKQEPNMVGMEARQ